MLVINAERVSTSQLPQCKLEAFEAQTSVLGGLKPWSAASYLCCLHSTIIRNENSQVSRLFLVLF